MTTIFKLYIVINDPNYKILDLYHLSPADRPSDIYHIYVHRETSRLSIPILQFEN